MPMPTARCNGCINAFRCQNAGSVRKTVHDSAWMLEKVIQNRLVTREQSGVLVFVTDGQQAEPAIDEALRVLSSVT